MGKKAAGIDCPIKQAMIYATNRGYQNEKRRECPNDSSISVLSPRCATINSTKNAIPFTHLPYLTVLSADYLFLDCIWGKGEKRHVPLSVLPLTTYTINLHRASTVDLIIFSPHMLPYYYMIPLVYRAKIYFMICKTSC